MRDNEKEDAWKRGGGGRINEGGRIHYTNSFDVEKLGGGGRINDGGRSGGTLRYLYPIISLVVSFCRTMASVV